MKFAAVLGALAGALVLAAPLGAEVTPTDLQVAARALSFMDKPLTGPVRVGILYAPDSPRSVRQADELQRMLGAGLKAGKLELKPVLVKVGEAAGANVDMYFLTEYVSTADAQTAGLSVAKRPCVTIDIAQVAGGTCLMGVRSTPKVEIVINRAAAKDSGVTFATVFRVMITEI
jgi:ABC-type uncharacterized transport system substrate-binding protein